MSTKEYSGLRIARAPNRNSLRAKLLAHFAEWPQSMLTRQEIMERHGVKVSALDLVIQRLKRDGQIKSLMGPGGVVSYVAATLPLAKLPRIKPEPKPKRDWPGSSVYIPPRPVATSIFDYAGTL